MRITQFNGVKDHTGQYGAAKIVSVNDEMGKKVSGFVPLEEYVEADWQVGKSHDLELENKGKFGWQFKWKRKAKPQAAAPDNDRVLNGLVELFKMVKKLQSDLDEIKSRIIPEQQPGQDSYEETPF